MKKLLFICLLVVLGSIAFAQTDPEWLWAVRAGGTDYDQGDDIARDSQGNLYVTGDFALTADFGPFQLTSSGENDIFIAKLDANGNWLWVVQAGGSGGDWGSGIKVDYAGNICVCGSFAGIATFGATTLTASGFNDIFAAKLDSNGNWLWAVRAGGASDYIDGGNSLTVDDAGNIYLTGDYHLQATFGPYPLTNSGETDIFIAKLDPNGNWLWARRAGGTGGDSGMGISADHNGNIYTTGGFGRYTNGAASFGPFTLVTNGSADIFAAKLDTNGNWLWAVSAGGSSLDDGDAIAVDDQGYVYLTGGFANTISFGSFTLTSFGDGDIFTAKLDTNGNCLWAKHAGGFALDDGGGIAVDDFHNVYLTGLFRGTATFGSTTLTASGALHSDIFAAKLDSGGNWLGALRAGGENLDVGNGITVDLGGNIYLTGCIWLTADFGLINLEGIGVTDIFVAKIYTGAPPDNDLAAVSITGNEYPDVGLPTDYTVTVYNNGLNAQNNYAVWLMQADDILLGMAQGTAIASRDSLSYTISWTPLTPGPVNLYGQVMLNGDENPDNNQTPYLPVLVSQLPGTVFALVYNTQNEAIQGATVSCGGASATTDNTGFCQLQPVAGIYDITASHPDYASATQSNVEVLSGQVVTVTFNLAATASDDTFAPAVQTALHSAYPNPARNGEEIRIKADIVTGESGTLTLYNLRGQCVTKYQLSSGAHQISVNGNNLPAGIYLYQLKTQTVSATKKLVLLK